jgi:hypothetical protein
MAGLIVFLLFGAAPFALGMRTGSHWSQLFPATLFALAVWAYATHDPTGDEVDVIAGMTVIFAVVGIVICFVGVLVGRRRRAAAERSGG